MLKIEQGPSSQQDKQRGGRKINTRARSSKYLILIDLACVTRKTRGREKKHADAQCDENKARNVAKFAARYSDLILHSLRYGECQE